MTARRARRWECGAATAAALAAFGETAEAGPTSTDLVALTAPAGAGR